MGLFRKKESKKEIAERIRNNECAQLLADIICKELSENGKYYEYLNKYRDNIHTISVGAFLDKARVNEWYSFHKGNGKICEQCTTSHEYYFKDLGYDDLPNQKYRDELHIYLINQVIERCPHLIYEKEDRFTYRFRLPPIKVEVERKSW